MDRAKSWKSVRIHTIGHSTRTLDELVALLRAFDVSIVADIRTIPRSRHNPQFDRDTLRSELLPRGLRYVHLPELGGLAARERIHQIPGGGTGASRDSPTSC